MRVMRKVTTTSPYLRFQASKKKSFHDHFNPYTYRQPEIDFSGFEFRGTGTEKSWFSRRAFELSHATSKVWKTVRGKVRLI